MIVYLFIYLFIIFVCLFFDQWIYSHSKKCEVRELFSRRDLQWFRVFMWRNKPHPRQENVTLLSDFQFDSEHRRLLSQTCICKVHTSMTSGEKTFHIRKASNATVRNLTADQCCFETDSTEYWWQGSQNGCVIVTGVVKRSLVRLTHLFGRNRNNASSETRRGPNISLEWKHRNVKWPELQQTIWDLRFSQRCWWRFKFFLVYDTM
jgi:hypothetical protein